MTLHLIWESFFVTPIVFSLVNYTHQKGKGGCPTFIGPVLLHHQMQHSMYNYFLNQITSLKPEVRNVKAVRMDGELTLCVISTNDKYSYKSFHTCSNKGHE